MDSANPYTAFTLNTIINNNKFKTTLPLLYNASVLFIHVKPFKFIT